MEQRRGRPEQAGAPAGPRGRTGRTEAAAPHSPKALPDAYIDVEGEPVRDLLHATLEQAGRREARRGPLAVGAERERPLTP